MSDAPLSRRARRDMEAQAAQRAAAQEDSAQPRPEAAVTGENRVVETGEQMVSRRDRRRLERLARPMESWTAEEEMLATGQIPTMTPERIAEQERLAREAAERAAVDAQTASAELRILAQRDLERRSADAPAPQADTPAKPTLPEPATPYSPRFEPHHGDSVPHGDVPVDPSPSHPVEFEATFARTPFPTGESQDREASERPAPWPQDFDGMFEPPSDVTRPADTPVDAPAAMPGDAHTRDDGAREAEAAAARAKVFEELFPPGSSQAALIEHDRRAREDAGKDIADDDPEEAQRQQGIEEFRRLTQAALSNIEGAAPPADSPTSTETVRPQESPPEQPEPARSHRYEMPEEPDEGAGFRGFGAPVTPASHHTPATSPMPDPGALAPPTGQFATRPPASFPHVPADPSSTDIPVRPIEQPSSSTGPENAPPSWDFHPLDAVQPDFPDDVNDFEPVGDVPRPDLSRLNGTPGGSQFSPTSGQIPSTQGQALTASGQFVDDPTVTGQIAPVRRLPELPPVGGAKHFKWLHLAVIGALMFLLGVVIYNVAWGQ